MADNEIILKVSLDGAEKETNKLVNLQTQIDKLAAQKKALNQTEKDLAKAVKEGNITRTQYTQQLKEVKAQQVENNASLKANKAAYRENERQLINTTKAQQLNKGSLVQLRAQLAKDTFEYDRLTKASRQNSKQGIALKKSIDSQVTSLKQLEKETGRTQRNVGNYGEAMNDVLPIMGGFGGQIMAVQRSLGAIQGALAKVTTAQKANAVATNTTSKSLKGFRLALIATGIGAIVIALGSLVAAFLSTQRGIDAVTKVLRPLQEIFQSLLGVMQDLATKGFDRIKKAIADPQQALRDFGNFIKDQFITRVLAIPKAFVAISSLILNSIKLLGTEIKKAVADVPLLGRLVDKKTIEADLKAAKQAVLDSAKELQDAQIELTLGVDADKVRALGAQAGKFFSDAAARGTEIDRLTKEIETAQITLNRELSKGLRIFEEQRSVAEDTNKTTDERLAAAKEAQAQLEKNAALEVGQLDRKLRLAKLEAEANDTDREAQQAIQDIIAEKEAVEARVLKKGLLLRNKANSIEQKAEKDRLKAIEENRKAQAKALEDLQKAKDQAAKNDIKREQETEKAILDHKMQQLQLEQQLTLATQELTEEEKFKLALETEQKLGALRIQQNELQANNLIKKEQELQNKLLQLKKESQGAETAEIINAQDELKEVTKEKERVQGEELTQVKLENKIAEAEILGEEETRQKEIEAEKKAEEDEAEKLRIEEQEAAIAEIKNAAVAAGEQFVQEAFNNQNRRVDENLAREVEALNLKREAGEINEEEFNKKRVALDKKAFKDRKRLSQAQNVVDFAVGAGKTVANLGYPAAIPALIPLAIQAATQAGIIASQKFAQGGIIHGASHANGGVQIGNGIEAEGGEAIINKKSTAKHLSLLSAINQDGGGVAFGSVAPNVGSIAKFANGGIAPSVSVQSETIDLNDLESRIAEAVGSIKVENVASETTGTANRVQQIEDSASF
jgi:hypothetical protein